MKFIIRYVNKLTDISSNDDKEALAMKIIVEHIEKLQKSNTTNEIQDEDTIANENRSLKTMLQNQLNDLENILFDIKLMDTQNDVKGQTYLQVGEI